MSRPEATPVGSRLLVVLPQWVGDVVLATPALAALRERFRAARITFLMRAHLAEIVAGAGWHDEECFWPRDEGAGWRGGLRWWRWLGWARSFRGRFDTAILLANSFRSALAVWLARVPRRVGYARDGRSWLLTDRVRAARHGGKFIPTPMCDYYARLAEHVACPVVDRMPRLNVTVEEECAVADLARHHGLDRSRPYAVIQPGAAFGAAKCWHPERFAEVCDGLAVEGVRPVLTGAGHEVPLLHRIASAAEGRPLCIDHPGTTLGSLKPLIRDAALLICNDTGPRHYGIAFRVPTVTVFGPTHQEWTRTAYRDEIRLQERVECGPCQLRTCPLDHRCMARISSAAVLAAARKLLDRRRSRGLPEGFTAADGAGDDLMAREASGA
jgi:heptosyltransferase-2